MEDLTTSDVRDLVYESSYDSVQLEADGLNQSMDWGDIKEELRQVQNTDDELSWSLKEVKKNILSIRYVVESSEYLIEGEVREGREVIDYIF